MKTTLSLTLTLLIFVTLTFVPNSFTQNTQPEYVVRVIYFIPNDREPEQDIDAKLDRLIKRGQQFYADEMERHGFGRNTFRLETDVTGKAVVQHVNGQFTSSHYVGEGNKIITVTDKVMPEINERFDMSRNIYLVVVDVGWAMGGVGSGESHSGFVLMTTNGDCNDTGSDFFHLATHELGHVFGLDHDFRNDAYILGYGTRVIVELSKCAAEWLDVHRYFNTNQTSVDSPTTIQMLPPIEYPANAIRLRFAITDADGLHQIQLKGPSGFRGFGLIACKRLNGQSNTVEFVTSEFTAGPDSHARVSVIDVNGNFTHQSYPIREEDVRVDVNNRVDINGDGVIDDDDRVPAMLRIVSGDNQPGSLNSWLAKPFVVEVRDANGEPVVGIEVAFRVRSDGALGALSATNPRTDSNGQARSILIPAYFGEYQVEASVAGVSKRVTFNNVVVLGPQVLVTQFERPVMYWISDGDSFGGGLLDGFTGDSVEGFWPFATSAAVDVSPGGKLYWTAATVPGKPFCGAVLRASREASGSRGSRSEELAVFNARPLAIAIDTTKGKLYWTNSHGNIQRANLDGSNIQDLITGLDSPKHIAVDTVQGKLYWTETQDSIRRANLNGSNVETLATGLSTLGSITIAGDKLYWTEKIGEELGKISRANLDGSNVEEIVTLSSVPVGVAVDIAQNKVYWTETRGHVRRANLDGSNIEDIISGLLEPAQLILNVPSVLTERLEIVSGGDQEGLPGSKLAKPFVVEVLNQFDKPVPSVRVTFSVSTGGGMLSAIDVTTDSNGRAESILTLGPNPGTNTVTVSAAGIPEGQTFNAVDIRVPKTLEIISGNDQEGLPGAALDKPFAVEVRDGTDKPLPGVEVTFSVTGGGGRLSVTSVTTNSNGRAESTLTLGPNPGTNTVTVSVTGIQGKRTVTAIAELPPIPQDVNGDDVVNILDLVLVASVLGDEGRDLDADVNRDGVVNILDLVLVAGAFGNVAAAPSVWYRDLEIAPTRADVGQWLAQAGELELTEATSQRGVLFLEQLLAALTPKETALLPNYPNPFNPETWIPYRLSEDADVTLTIYDTTGVVVRRLDLGHQLAGHYADRGRAAYWDGRNARGESVASGVYFYTLTAGDFTATRKMLIRK